MTFQSSNLFWQIVSQKLRTCEVTKYILPKNIKYARYTKRKLHLPGVIVQNGFKWYWTYIFVVQKIERRRIEKLQEVNETEKDVGTEKTKNTNKATSPKRSLNKEVIIVSPWVS